MFWETQFTLTKDLKSYTTGLGNGKGKFAYKLSSHISSHCFLRTLVSNLHRKAETQNFLTIFVKVSIAFIRRAPLTNNHSRIPTTF